jgi:flagellar motor component MotA
LKEDIKTLLKFILGILAFLYIYGTAGSLEFDLITVWQALIRCGAVFGAVIVGAVISAIKQNREER